MQVPAETLWPLILTSAGVAAIVSAGATPSVRPSNVKTVGKSCCLARQLISHGLVPSG